MDQPIDPFFQFEEGTIRGHVPNLAFYNVAHIELLGNQRPGINFQLLDPE